MIERDGERRMVVVSDLKAKSIQTVVRENVAKGSTLMNDEHGVYTGLRKDFRNHILNRGVGEYVQHYAFHTNSIESVWAIFNRQIIGIYHWVYRSPADGMPLKCHGGSITVTSVRPTA